jgi:HD-like signal output (HDOD) protein
MINVLFVDDEPRLLQGLRRMLHSERARWDMTFADGSKAALAALAEHPFDVIVTDYRMPEMNGGDLLRVVMDRHPGVVRLVLSGHTDAGELQTVVGVAHQFLTKPCERESLIGAVDRALALRSRLTASGIRDAVGSIDALPSPPSIIHDLQQALESPSCSTRDIADVVERDIGLAARVLQLVNSSFFSLGRRVTDVREAVSYLGINTIKGIALSAALVRTFRATPASHFCIQNLEAHAVEMSFLARQLAGQDIALAEDAFCTALLQDVGLLVLASTDGPRFAQCHDAWQTAGDRTLAEVERDLLGFTHGEVGAYLLNLWGLPDAVACCIADHGLPHDGPALSPTAELVHEAHRRTEAKLGATCGTPNREGA